MVAHTLGRCPLRLRSRFQRFHAEWPFTIGDFLCFTLVYDARRKDWVLQLLLPYAVLSFSRP